MPTVGVNRDDLFRSLEKTFTDDGFQQLCFEFGIELDEVTSEKQIKLKEQGAAAALGSSEDVIYKIDVPANRYDLLCIEGISRALRIFLGKENSPIFKTVEPVNNGKRHRITVKADTMKVRPFVVCAILRDITFNQKIYDSFIDLQDKLHQNICRRRKYAAIGTHDLDTIQGPFTYEALPPQDINFIPLSQSKVVSADKLMEIYRTNPDYKHLKPYTDIIADSPLFPVIYDSNRVVLSLPPIINGEHSKLTLNTKNIFIDCTATDITKANIVLNTLVSMFSQYCEKPFTVEAVDVVYEHDQRLESYPNLGNRQMSAKVKDVKSMIFGKQENPALSTEEICKLCSKMQLDAEYIPQEEMIHVQVPPTRSDILHSVDIIEDVAIAYGYNNIPRTIPPTATIGGAQPLNKLTDSLRDEISRAGYIELLTHGLCSHDENFALLNRKDDGKSAVVLSNPATIEFEIVRTTMIPGVLKTIQNNKSMSMKDGLKLFEISDVVVLDPSVDTGATNKRRLCAVYTGQTAGFEIIHGLVDRVMQLLGISNEMMGKTITSNNSFTYRVVPSTGPTFFPGRCADVILTKEDSTSINLGSFGVVHPDVLRNFSLLYPCSLMEIDIEPLL